ncbi:HAD family hydrolase [Piscirickettsia salmonis]|uniref:HAD family hydrolase n=1 Tax=Piscirickettsia salmonis TaxID=1238 RepID=UPI003751B0C4
MEDYQCLIFDLDDTLYNFAYAQSIALEKLYARYFGDVCRYDDFKERYQAINRSYWQQVEAGVIRAGQLSVLRFTELKECFKTTALVKDLVEFYHHESCTLPVWCQGAEQALPLLTKQFSCALLSNGTRRDQLAKLQALGLMDAFYPVIFSDELGVSKPNSDVFQPILNTLNVQPKDCLLIGDSLTSDYQAALNIGMDFCWFNEKNVKYSGESSPKIEINSLMELVRYLRMAQATVNDERLQSK